MKILTSRAHIPALVLLALACLPVATRADTFTLDGAPVVSLSFGTVVTVSGTTEKTFTVEMATADAALYYTDIMLGTKIDLLTLDEFITAVDGTTTENALDFADDTVEKYNITPGTDMLSSDVTFTYEKLTIMDDVGSGNGNGNGNGNGVPEPSSAALLASGLLGLIGFARKKHATARGDGHPVCCHS
jgi:hypothetical protein